MKLKKVLLVMILVWVLKINRINQVLFRYHEKEGSDEFMIIPLESEIYRFMLAVIELWLSIKGKVFWGLIEPMINCWFFLVNSKISSTFFFEPLTLTENFLFSVFPWDTFYSSIE